MRENVKTNKSLEKPIPTSVFYPFEKRLSVSSSHRSSADFDSIADFFVLVKRRRTTVSGIKNGILGRYGDKFNRNVVSAFDFLVSLSRARYLCACNRRIIVERPTERVAFCASRVSLSSTSINISGSFLVWLSGWCGRYLTGKPIKAHRRRSR